MAPDAAAADQAKDADTRPKAVEEPKPEAAGAVGASPEGAKAPEAPAAGGGGSLGERQVQAKSVVGGEEDPAEKAADAAADQVMRQPDPAEQGAAKEEKAPPPTGGSASTPGGSAPLVATPAVPAAGEKAGAETGTPAPPAEPPAPAGEQPARTAPEVSEDTQAYLDASRGKGAPLPEKARKNYEAKFQRDFGDVRIHDGSAADDAAKSIDALAFTRGNDIYFRAGAYDPEGGGSLLAHELAHVVQQRPGINRKVAPGLGGAVIRRTKNASGGAAKPPSAAPTGTITGTAITIDTLKVPQFKATKTQGKGPFKLRKEKREDKPTAQAAEWRRSVKSGTDSAFTTRLSTIAPAAGAEAIHYLEVGGTAIYLIGAKNLLALESRVPGWDKGGKKRSFDIDHLKEAQLGGEDKGNLWLLDSAKNRSAGSTIKGNIDTTIRAFLEAKKADPAAGKVPDEADVRNVASKWTVEFKTLTGDGATDVKDEEFWEEADMATAKLFHHVAKVPQAKEEELRGTPSKLSIYGKKSGGEVKHIDRKGDKTTVSDWGKEEQFQITEVIVKDSDQGKGGQLKGTAFKKDTPTSPMQSAPLDMPLKPMPGIDWGGLAAPGSINFWRAKAFSPVTIPEPEFDVKKILVARGVIPKPDLKLLEKVELAVVVDGDVSIEATVTGGDLQLPGPFKVKGGSLTLRAGTGGVGISGQIDFEIEKLAKGYIKAAADTKSGFALEGNLDFDTEMFTEASLGISYKDGKWGVNGKLGVGPGKIKGIKRASAAVQVLDDTVTATGEFETSIKGIDKGQVGFKYDPVKGMEITGVIELGKGVPGIRSGKLDATIKQSPAGGYTLGGGISIIPSIPGIAGAVTGKYEDGAFLVEAELGYERGRAAGKVKLGVTNQAIGPDGKPNGPPQPDGALIAYGGGSVTLTLTPWLKGTVGIQLKPNGEIELTGEVALPSSFEVFPEKKVEKRVFSIGIDIPIIGVAVAGQRIGIFATIRGGLDVRAGFGPGQLKDVALRVTYNPDHEDQTKVTGTGTFFVPAGAGLRLSVDGGLGAGIPIVSATAGLTIFGEVGVAGAASASAMVEWSPGTGVVLDAKGELSVQPKFKFGIEAFVDVSADLLVTTIELYKRKWSLASFEYGSNLKFGLLFPLHYESGKPFELSFDQIQWTYPTIDPADLLGGLMKQLVG